MRCSAAWIAALASVIQSLSDAYLQESTCNQRVNSANPRWSAEGVEAKVRELYASALEGMSPSHSGRTQPEERAASVIRIEAGRVPHSYSTDAVTCCLRTLAVAYSDLEEVVVA
jgi:predicted phage gp36 major capsid-like protein